MRKRGESQASQVAVVLDDGRAWSLLRQLASAASAGAPARDAEGLALHRERLLRDAGAAAWIVVRGERAQGWEPVAAVTPAARELFELYLSLCAGARAPTLWLAHLGQSLDGRIATVAGASRFITGEQDVRHTHRLRALSDAVLVGVQTVVADDPALTTRLVPGAHPVRVVLDPHARLPADARVLHDGIAPTVVVRGGGAGRASSVGDAEVLALPAPGGCFEPTRLVAALAERGLRRVFVEGGGVTVSRLLHAGVLDRLQVAIAPTLIGSGSAAFSLPPLRRLEDALRVRARRFELGADVLFDCDLRGDG